MRLLGKVGFSLVTVVVVALALLVGASMVPIPGHTEMKIVLSGSMEPAIHTGSIVVVRPAASYAVGDVITFGPDTKRSVPTTHRVIEVRQEGGQTFYRTKGDANNAADNGETRAGAVEGKVLFSIPYAGYVLDFSKRPLGFALLIAVPAALIVLSELITILREVRGLRSRKRAPEPAPEGEADAWHPAVLDLRGRAPHSRHRL